MAFSLNSRLCHFCWRQIFMLDLSFVTFVFLSGRHLHFFCWTEAESRNTKLALGGFFSQPTTCCTRFLIQKWENPLWNIHLRYVIVQIYISVSIWMVIYQLQVTYYLQRLTRRMLDESLGKSWSNENFHLCLITPTPQEFNQLFEGADIASQSKRRSSMKKLKGEGWDKHLISSWIKVFNQWVITNFWLRNVGTERPNPDIPEKTSRHWLDTWFSSKDQCHLYELPQCYAMLGWYNIHSHQHRRLSSTYIFSFLQ